MTYEERKKIIKEMQERGITVTYDVIEMILEVLGRIDRDLKVLEGKI